MKSKKLLEDLPGHADEVGRLVILRVVSYTPVQVSSFKINV